MNDRQEKQLAFDRSVQNLTFGSLSGTGLTLEDLVCMDFRHKYVVKTYDSGLTATVFKVKTHRLFNYKKKRATSLVKNIDGQTSFLNEIQRRIEFAELSETDSVIERHMVKTVYADYRQGVLLSEWIEGNHPATITESFVDQLLDVSFAMQRKGTFEWDLCSGNLLIDPSGTLKLFDFGYCYRFDPLKEINPEGLNAPMFHALERFETRYSMFELLKIEEENSLAQALKIYKMTKEVAIRHYSDHVLWLTDHHACAEVVDFFKALVNEWQAAIDSKENLYGLYKKEAIRSHILDIHDDLAGQSCTVNTLKRLDAVLNWIVEDYDLLNSSDSFFWEDQSRTKDELVIHYESLRKPILQFQLLPKKTFE
ncbi:MULTISPECIES: AarF/UbiB family protein [unclassified Fusibacter]|uniref:AarF/UbiB family protein n=1 Tax=unclassified Fusibacter TaxID=2624464 RepID=UPI001010B746|nr:MULTISPECIES: AarF/UbiB family protein [unclassified Fusibacter]MCK8061597.1 AarF/UbiB family protein [Fusibacter sp. A2]NPE23780.1 phosphotransferase [Fusibacter sp. A1]RXV58685.1 phosphotransferase [Fusibacter sp. A1]